MMSRIPKYFTSEDFDAPVLLGDAWGYLNNVFRKCLVEGYNQRLDLSSYTIIDNKSVRFTFDTAHNYRQYQVLKISDIGNNELHDECMIESVTDLTITCSYYKELYTPIDTNTGSLTGKSIVAPLGMREKWRDGDRSVYVVDQEVEECFLTVDARTPANWTALVTGTTYPASITPVVYMTDGMSDIDTITGNKIAPYDTAFPIRFNSEWVGTSSTPHKGIGFFISYTRIGGTTTNNKALAATTKNKWKIIGNGRFFYLITESIYYPDRATIQFFGKFKSSRNSLDYGLLYSSADISHNQYAQGIIIELHPQQTNSISNSNSNYKYSGSNFELLSDIKNVSKVKAGMNVGYSQVENAQSYISYNKISGNVNLKKYDHNGKIQLSDFTILENGDIVGLIPSVKFLNQNIPYLYGNIYNINVDGESKKYIYIKNESAINGSTLTTTYSYLFSLNYQDWKNYD